MYIRTTAFAIHAGYRQPRGIKARHQRSPQTGAHFLDFLVIQPAKIENCNDAIDENRR